MGDLSEFNWKRRLQLKLYQWRRIDPVPWTPPAKPLSACKLGLVSSAGLILPGQEPFDTTVRGGDWAYREIPAGVDVATLLESHRSEAFDHAAVQQDPNVAFPIDRVHELAAAGRIGTLNQRFFSFMGSLTAVRRFEKFTVSAVTEAFVADGVDVALLVPI